MSHHTSRAIVSKREGHFDCDLMTHLGFRPTGTAHPQTEIRPRSRPSAPFVGLPPCRLFRTQQPFLQRPSKNGQPLTAPSATCWEYHQATAAATASTASIVLAFGLSPPGPSAMTPPRRVSHQTLIHCSSSAPDLLLVSSSAPPLLLSALVSLLSPPRLLLSLSSLSCLSASRCSSTPSSPSAFSSEGSGHRQSSWRANGGRGTQPCQPQSCRQTPSECQWHANEQRRDAGILRRRAAAHG